MIQVGATATHSSIFPVTDVSITVNATKQRVAAPAAATTEERTRETEAERTNLQESQPNSKRAWAALGARAVLEP